MSELLKEPARLNFQLYNKPKGEELVYGSPTIHPFEYSLQWVPFLIYLAVSLAVAAITAVFYYVNPFETIGAYVVFGGGIFASLALFFYALYGQHVTASALIGVSVDAFYTGTRHELWRIDWSLVDLKEVDFDSRNRFTGKVFFKVGGEKIPIYLPSNLVAIDEFPSLIASMVECTRRA